MKNPCGTNLVPQGFFCFAGVGRKGNSCNAARRMVQSKESYDVRLGMCVTLINCPKCNRPVSGRARACGYCGASLVQDYFNDEMREVEADGGESISGGSVAAMVFGVFGAIALLVALVFQVLLLFGYGDGQVPAIDLMWWLRTGCLLVVPVVYLAMQLSLRGWRRSMKIDIVWLLISTAGLVFSVLAYLENTLALFSHSFASMYLVGIGFALMFFASILGILSFKRAVVAAQ